MKRQLRKKMTRVYISACMLVFPVFMQVNGQTVCDNGQGSQGGYTYEYWKDQGSGCMVLGSGGTFEVDWNNINNLLARKGLRPGSMNQTVTYAADYQPNGNSYLCVYGWTTNPLVEYYIVDSWGSWRPPGGEGYITTITSDGGTYDIYRTQRVNQPSIEGNATFYQYWSVRTSKRTSGTITCANHFNAWESNGMDMGNLYEVSFCVEGYQSSGTANVYQMSMSTGSGSSSGGSSSGGSSSGGSSSGGNSGDGEYTVTVRARGIAGGEHLNVLINNQVQADINLSTSWQEYEVYVDRGDLSLEFDNDGGDRDAQVDWIEVHGETRQAEDMASNTAVYQDGSCGGSYSELMHCNGAIGFGDITYDDGGSSSGGSSSGGSSSGGTGSNSISVRARGIAGGEHINLLVNNQVVGDWNLTTSYQTLSASTNNSGDIQVQFDNDGGDLDVQVDYITVNGSTRQAEDQSYNTAAWDGECGGGSYTEMMHCNGVIGFGEVSGSSGGSSSGGSSSGGSSSGGTGGALGCGECDWYGTDYPLCCNTTSGWGWENNMSCISPSTCINIKSANGTMVSDFTSVEIYPNPVKDVLNISVNSVAEVDVDAVIYSASGAVIKQFVVQPGESSINLSELSEGMYIMKITVDNKTFTKKLFR